MTTRCYIINLTKKQETKLNKVNRNMSSKVTTETCQIINSTLLDVRENNKQRLELGFDLEEA